MISKDITRLLTSSQRGSVFRDVAQEKRKDASQAFRGMIWQRALASIFPSTGETRFALGVCRGFCEASTRAIFYMLSVTTSVSQVPRAEAAWH